MSKTQKTKTGNEDSYVEVTMPDGLSSLFTPISIIMSAIIIASCIIWGSSKISTALNGDDSTLGAEDTNTDTTQDTTGDTNGNTEAQLPGDYVRDFETFTEYDTDICKEDGKPVVYLFSTTWCPHCEWVAATFDKWAKDNKSDITAYHWQLDTGDNTLTSDVETEVPAEHQAVYEKFNPGGSIPTFVFGCRYGRVGNGYETEDDLDKEKKSFDAVVEELTKS
ncbi:thioredoxin family protein [Candidatus Dojkabacteria bacterium]|nr:thioredoxin family protein [Candidatus Dojkabacteria bacterium]